MNDQRSDQLFLPQDTTDMANICRYKITCQAEETSFIPFFSHIGPSGLVLFVSFSFKLYFWSVTIPLFMTATHNLACAHFQWSNVEKVCFKFNVQHDRNPATICGICNTCVVFTRQVQSSAISDVIGMQPLPLVILRWKVEVSVLGVKLFRAKIESCSIHIWHTMWAVTLAAANFSWQTTTESVYGICEQHWNTEWNSGMRMK